MMQNRTYPPLLNYHTPQLPLKAEQLPPISPGFYIHRSELPPIISPDKVTLHLFAI